MATQHCDVRTATKHRPTSPRAWKRRVGSRFAVWAAGLGILSWVGASHVGIAPGTITADDGTSPLAERSVAVQEGAGTGAASAAQQNLTTSPSWLTGVQEHLEAREYRASVTAAGLQAPNRAHRLRTYFEPTGVRVVDRETPGSPDLLHLQLRHIGREGVLLPVAPGTVTHDGPRVEIAHDAITQWFLNGPEGLEQGFTIEARPAGQGSLRVDIGVGAAAVSPFGSGLAFHSDEGRRLKYDKLYAEDADGRPLPSAMVANTGGFAIEVDDTGAAYPILIDPLLTGVFDAEVESNQISAALGSHVAAAGDVNGDGYADVLVGAEFYDGGHTNEGAIFLYHGGPGGIGDGHAFNADTVFESNRTQVWMHRGTAAGDVNGDGYGDVLIGCDKCGSGQSSEGLAMVFYGSATGIPDGTPETAPTLLQSNVASSFFAKSVATAGDVNGDGYDDILIGNPNYTNGEALEGAAFVYLGSAGGIPDGSLLDADTAIEGQQVFSGYGWSVASAGDVNGDGFSEIVVGASLYDFVRPDSGVAFVYHGGSNGILSVSEPTMAGAIIDSDSSHAGIAVSAAGDTNGDGYGDVLIGFPFYESDDRGLALLVEGSVSGLPDAYPGFSSTSFSALSLSGENAGSSVASAGDLNGDGYSDIVIGAPGYRGLFQVDERGAAMVFLGGQGGIPSGGAFQSDHFLLDGQVESRLGESVAGLGDVDGDGYDDLIVGAPDFDGPQTDEGQAFVYHGGAHGIEDGTAFDADAQLESNQPSAQLGYSVASAGDVDGDGLSDIIVGAPFFDNGQNDEGAAFLFLGDVEGLSGSSPASAHALLESDQANAQFGASVASAGDVDGDGYGDVIVGARYYEAGAIAEGAAFVFLGSDAGIADGDPVSAHAQLEGDQAGASFGVSVASAGDTNGDGYGDVIVGAFEFDGASGAQSGAAFVFLGGVSGIADAGSGSADTRLESDQASAFFGSSVASAGDVNGDGYGDVIASAAGYSAGELSEGAAFVFLGSAGGIAHAETDSAHVRIESDQDYASLGTSVASAGDVNADGYGDIIVGASLYDTAVANEGAAFVFLGSTDGIVDGHVGSAHAQLLGDGTVEAFGRSVASAGDVNGDGYGDLAVGSSYLISSHVGAGFVFLGSATGIPSGGPSTANAQLFGNQLASNFGASVASAGDVNGDGFGDLIVGARFHDAGDLSEGAAFLYYGSGEGRPVAAIQHRIGSIARIQPHAAPGTDTGFEVSLSATSPRGRELAKLEVEVCPAGAAFGTLGACITSLSATWTDLGTTGTFLYQDVSGLAGNVSYRWRARVWTTPFFATTPGVTPSVRVGPWRRQNGTASTSDVRVLPEPSGPLAGLLGAMLLTALRRRRAGEGVARR